MHLGCGDTGVEVERLQVLLGIKADGDFGPATVRAVAEFQRTNGLVATGDVGSRTRELLIANASIETLTHWSALAEATRNVGAAMTGITPELRAIRGQLEPHVVCQAGAHQIDPNQKLSYLDGELVAFCSNCSDRLNLTWFPGGTYAPQALSEIEQILAKSSSDDAEHLVEIRRKLEDDARRVQDVLYSVGLAEKVVANRMREQADVGARLRQEAVATEL